MADDTQGEDGLVTDPHSATGTGSRTNVGRARSASPRRSRRRRLVGALLALGGVVAGVFVVRAVIPQDLDDGFIAFEPDVALFPAAPVANADTVLGIGRPESMPTAGSSDCPFGIGWWPDITGNGWHTVRHDWQQDGSPKAWIISEATMAIEEDGAFAESGEFDRFQRNFFDAIKYCGWNYEGAGVRGEYNAVLTEVAGLPDGSFAFTSSVSPYSATNEKFGDSDPADYRALTAFVPGPKHGQMMWLSWTGWGTDVPRDEFVRAVNRLYDAAHSEPDPGDDATPGESDAVPGFVPFEFDRSGLSNIVGEDEVSDSDFRYLSSRLCGRSRSSRKIQEFGEQDDARYDAISNETRTVGILSARFSDRSRYLYMKEQMIDAVAPICIDTLQHQRFLIEPLAVVGAPEGTVASVWHGSSGEHTAVVTDDDRQLMLVVVWNEADGQVSTDDFAEVVTRAWNQFESDNP